MHLVIAPDGTLRCLYQEDLDLEAFGILAIKRASHVEPDEGGHWFADLAPAGGPRLGPYSRRSEALAAEAEWLETNALAGGPSQ